MKTKKINLEKFENVNLYARLHFLKQNFDRNFDWVEKTDKQINDYVLNLTKKNFIYEPFKEPIIKDSLILFLIGSDKSSFSKWINKYEQTII